MQFTNHIHSPNTHANKTHARTYNAPIHDSYMHAVGFLRGVFQLKFNPLCGRNLIETDLD